MGQSSEIVVLSGGLGGARLAMAAVESGWTHRATFITNVGDDWSIGDLPICPDTDAVIYGLTGRFDEARGWGVRCDRFRGPRENEPGWFGIGDKDRATHECRRDILLQGATLQEATMAMTRGLTDARVTPVTNDRVRTMVRIGRKWLPFQSWLVREQAPQPDEVRWDGVDQATPAPGVLETIDAADVVVIASSSPVASIGPIMATPGIRAALAARTGPVIALSPISSRPFVSQRDRRRAMVRERLMRSRNMEHTAGAVASWLSGTITHFALDDFDAHLIDDIATTGLTPMVLPVVALDNGQRELVSRILIRETLAVSR
jgi:LPPG:FO 2-phospho-L-lactate transferase